MMDKNLKLLLVTGLFEVRLVNNVLRSTVTKINLLKTLKNLNEVYTVTSHFIMKDNDEDDIIYSLAFYTKNIREMYMFPYNDEIDKENGIKDASKIYLEELDMVIEDLFQLTEHPEKLSRYVKWIYKNKLQFSSTDLLPFIDLMDEEARDLVIFNLEKEE